MTRPVRAVIDIAALHQNLRRAGECAPVPKHMAVVKADGYGHGLLRVAAAMREVDGLAVAGIDQALALRNAGYRQPICLLSGFHEADELPEIAAHDLTVVVHCEQQLDQLAQARLPRPISIWVKVDTGMHRIGFSPDRLPGVVQQLQQLPLAPSCLMSHLANADDCQDALTEQQCRRFTACSGAYFYSRSLANSAGVMAWQATHFDWLRPGIMLYGASPLLQPDAHGLGLTPVMTLESRLIAINRLNGGDAIGYGGDWVCPQAMPVGVVAGGYGDGYPRHAANGTPVWVGGRQLPLIGRVSMDMITVDLRQHPHAQVGDKVVLWGPPLPVDLVAQHAATIAYELLCGVTPRVPRIEINVSDQDGG